MKMQRQECTKKGRGEFEKFEATLSVLSFDLHQNELAGKRSKKAITIESRAEKNLNSEGNEVRNRRSRKREVSE